MNAAPSRNGPGPQPVGCGDVAGGEGGAGHTEVPGGFVQAHGQAAARRPDEVHLHHDGGGPGQALADPKNHVGGDDPAPGRSENQQQRHREGDEPTGDEDRLAAVPVREGAGEVVGSGLGQPEREDIGQGRRIQVELENLRGQQRQHGALLPKGSADEGVDSHQQHELGQVLPQSQRDAGPGAGLLS